MRAEIMTKGGSVEGAPSAFGNPAIGLELKPREILRVPSPRVARSLLTQQ